MRLRPAQARWFETYVPRDAGVRASAALAATGAVQLELDPRLTQPADLSRLRYFLDRFRSLAAEHARDLPRAGGQATALLGDPVHLASQALHQLQVWSARIVYLKAHIEALHAEVQQLERLAEFLQAMASARPGLDGLFRETGFLCKSLFACPIGHIQPAEVASSPNTLVPGRQHDFLYLADLPGQGQAARQLALARGCQPVGIPAWLAEHPEHLPRRLEHTRSDLSGLEAELKDLRHASEIGRARAEIDTLRWYLDHAARYLGDGALCHITGWTTARDRHDLQRALRQANIEAVVRFPLPPPELATPVSTLDTWWTRPFQPFLALWGTPGRTEVDPSALLVLIVPLLFGYMFPDVGHGFVLALIAGLTWTRQPRLRFLLPCGLAAMAFGFLFGEVFGLHGLLPAFWLYPLNDPLPVLVVPILFGAILMLLGQVLAGIEAHWRGDLRPWLLLDGSVLGLYVAALLALAWPPALWLATWALLQYGLASLFLAAPGKRLDGLARALGELVLSVFELAMNTLSFLRVGAFALAHAALSHAVLTLAEATSSPWAWGLVILAGNLFAIAVEGLLVFVQTTRLVLFEFFLRFLAAEGRLFRPMPREAAAGKRHYASGRE